MSATGRVLVVDDQPLIANVLAEQLRQSGYTVKIALSGADALDLFDTFQPDVVLLDLTMPGLTGGEVLDRVRTTYPHIPVVVMTGDAGRARETLARGAVAYLVKPFKMGALTATVGEVLGQR